MKNIFISLFFDISLKKIERNCNLGVVKFFPLCYNKCNIFLKG